MREEKSEKVVCMDFNMLGSSPSFLLLFSPGCISAHFGEVSPTVIAENCCKYYSVLSIASKMQGLLVPAFL